MITYVQIFVGPAPQKFGRAKNSISRPDFGQLSSLSANILETDRDIKKSETDLTDHCRGWVKPENW